MNDSLSLKWLSLITTSFALSSLWVNAPSSQNELSLSRMIIILSAMAVIGLLPVPWTPT
jgi:hypothetical protein